MSFIWTFWGSFFGAPKVSSPPQYLKIYWVLYWAENKSNKSEIALYLHNVCTLILIMVLILVTKQATVKLLQPSVKGN